jgi:hypothetical protein
MKLLRFKGHFFKARDVVGIGDLIRKDGYTDSAGVYMELYFDVYLSKYKDTLTTGYLTQFNPVDSEARVRILSDFRDQYFEFLDSWLRASLRRRFWAYLFGSYQEQEVIKYWKANRNQAIRKKAG